MAEAIDYEVVNLPRDDEGPVFEDPWQAQVFSLTVHLHKAGHFTWPQWVRTFSREIGRSPALPGESVNAAYYRQWAAALEHMVAKIGLAGLVDVAGRTEEWRQAYINTPHGHPVLLANAACPPAHDHHHHVPERSPVAISPACPI